MFKKYFCSPGFIGSGRGRKLSYLLTLSNYLYRQRLEFVSVAYVDGHNSASPPTSFWSPDFMLDISNWNITWHFKLNTAKPELTICTFRILCLLCFHWIYHRPSWSHVELFSSLPAPFQVPDCSGCTISRIQPFLSNPTATLLVVATAICHLNYCNNS